MNVTLNVICNFVRPPVNTCWKRASGCYVAVGASVLGSGLSSVCDECVVLERRVCVWGGLMAGGQTPLGDPI